jgi:hypothetical protein
MLGGGTITTVFNPPIATSLYSHSIAQTWTFSRSPYPDVCDASCSGSGCLQSVEIGWNVDKSTNGGTTHPLATHLFIFSTSQDYSNGCYNQFQTATTPSCMEGGALGSSIAAQMEFAVNYGTYPYETEFDTYNYDGDWYLAVNGITAFLYYGDQYNGSFETSAGAFQVGGEVETTTGSSFDVLSQSTSWPLGYGIGMGSGYCAESSPSAYHRGSYFYYDGGGGSIDWWVVGLSPQDYAPPPTSSWEYYYDYNQSKGEPYWGTGTGPFFYFGGVGTGYCAGN